MKKRWYLLIGTVVMLSMSSVPVMADARLQNDEAQKTEEQAAPEAAASSGSRLRDVMLQKKQNKENPEAGNVEEEKPEAGTTREEKEIPADETEQMPETAAPEETAVKEAASASGSHLKGGAVHKKLRTKEPEAPAGLPEEAATRETGAAGGSRLKDVLTQKKQPEEEPQVPADVPETPAEEAEKKEPVAEEPETEESGAAESSEPEISASETPEEKETGSSGKAAGRPGSRLKDVNARKKQKQENPAAEQAGQDQEEPEQTDTPAEAPEEPEQTDTPAEKPEEGEPETENPAEPELSELSALLAEELGKYLAGHSWALDSGIGISFTGGQNEEAGVVTSTGLKGIWHIECENDPETGITAALRIVWEKGRSDYYIDYFHLEEDSFRMAQFADPGIVITCTLDDGK